MISFTPMLFRPAKSILFFRLTSLIFFPRIRLVSLYKKKSINNKRPYTKQNGYGQTTHDVVETNVTENIHHGVTVVYVLSFKSQI